MRIRSSSLVFIFYVIAVTFVSAELLLRVGPWSANVDRQMCGNQGMGYKYDKLLGWFPVPGASMEFTASQKIHIQNSAMGFRDVEHLFPSAKPVVVFIGDSYVWGYDVNVQHRFTELLRKKLPGAEIVNMGVSGYGTDQELLLLLKHVAKFRPAIVMLMMSFNDTGDNRTNFAYDMYKPYFAVSQGQIRPMGIPPPKSLYYLTKEKAPWLFRSRAYLLLCRLAEKGTGRMRQVDNPSVALAHGVRDVAAKAKSEFGLGQIDSVNLVPLECAKGRLPCVDLRDIQGKNLRFPEYGNHWTEKGHQIVADRLYNYFSQRGWIQRFRLDHQNLS